MNNGKRIATMLLFAAILAAITWASGNATNYPCDTNIPRCPPDSPNGSNGQGSSWGGCGPAWVNAWMFDGPVPINYYSCNGRSTDCGNPGSQCNVMLLVSGQGFILTCEPAGWTAVCMSSVSPSPTPLNIRCDGGGKCKDTGPNDVLPPNLIPPVSSPPDGWINVPTPTAITFPVATSAN